MYENPALRASDADREATVDRLRRAHADGRLDADELPDRIDCCYHARTLGELAALVADLPREPAVRDARPAARRAWRPMLLLPIVLAVVFVGAATHGHIIWIIPLLFSVRLWVLRRGRWGRRWV